MSQSNLVGKSLGGRYQITRLLGQGGMSAVYRATDPNLHREVAIKVIHPQFSHNPEFVGRFEQEAAAVARLRHPNIVQVYDFNNDDELYFMVLEFVEGRTLFEILQDYSRKGEHIPYKDAIQIAMQVAEAAEYAHKKGMIHRDIKPANVMIDPQGQAVLMDFGIAKIVGGQIHTAAGAVIGTAKYMAPEQVRGDAPDHRTDIYSIGVVLFEMASGKPPFDADSAISLMMKHLQDPLPNLRELQPDIPDSLVTIISKSLAKDPASRYQTAGDLAKALKKAHIRYEAKEDELFRTVQMKAEDLSQAITPPKKAAEADLLKTQKVASENFDQEAPPAEPPGIDKTVRVDSETAAESESFETRKIDTEKLEAPDVLKTQLVSPPGKPMPEAGAPAAPSSGPEGTMVVDEGKFPYPTKGEDRAGGGTRQPSKASGGAGRRPNLALWGGIIGAVVLIGIILGVFAFGGGGGSANPTASATSAAAVVKQESATALPSETSIPPTPQPTATEYVAETVPPATEPPATEPAVEAATSAPTEAVAANPMGNPGASQPGEVYFTTEFDNPLGEEWQASVSSNNLNDVSAEASGGVLHMKILPGNLTFWLTYGLPLDNPDVRVETHAIKVGGPNSNEIGVTCRVGEAGGYQLTYSSNGKWHIWRFDQGQAPTELASGNSNAINMAEHPNDIAATCIGNELSLYINGTLIGSATDDTYTQGGSAGLVIWGEFPDLAVDFEYITATVP
jgi:serine/threonine protein kinase